mgnify:CR=1 FL=1
MNLCISNIAWPLENDTEMYCFLQDNGIKGLEIAPTRIFQNNPYDHLKEAEDWANNLYQKYGLKNEQSMKYYFDFYLLHNYYKK